MSWCVRLTVYAGSTRVVADRVNVLPLRCLPTPQLHGQPDWIVVHAPTGHSPDSQAAHAAAPDAASAGPAGEGGASTGAATSPGAQAMDVDMVSSAAAQESRLLLRDRVRSQVLDIVRSLRQHVPPEPAIELPQPTSSPAAPDASLRRTSAGTVQL